MPLGLAKSAALRTSGLALEHDVFRLKQTSVARNPLMPSIPNAAVTVAILAVAVVLVLGLVNMMREGASNTSQKLMRWRVGLQFLAIVIVVVVLLTRTH